MRLDGWIVVIFLIAIVGSVVKSARKSAQKRPGQSPQPQRKPPKPAAQASSWEENFPPELREVLAQNRHKGTGTAKKYTLKPMGANPVNTAKRAPVEGASPVSADGGVGGPAPHGADTEGRSVAYADGCVGGSLPHDDKPRQRATLHGQAPDTSPVLLDATSHVKCQPQLTAAEMRRAVVTAEVLARPVALRPHGYRL